MKVCVLLHKCVKNTLEKHLNLILPTQKNGGWMFFGCYLNILLC